MRRAATLVALLAGVALVAAVACGGDEGTDPPGTSRSERTMIVSIETFTPVPPDYTPEALRTRSAQQTAYAQTATALPPLPATAPPNVTVQPGPLATAAPGEIRPPDALLQTSGGETTGAVGSFNWFSVETQKGANISAPYVIVSESDVTWATGTAAQIVVPNSPFGVTGADIAVYNVEGNMVIPTDPSGSPIGDRPAFFAQEQPLQQQRVDGATISVQPNVPPGRYIVEVRIDFAAPPELPFPLFVQYAFSVNVI